jgi:hypothetical protein
LPEILYERPRLYAKQEAALFTPKRYSLVEATTKAGKTVGCIAWQIEEAVLSPAGTQHVWVAPIASQAAIAFQRLKRGLPPGTFVARETPTPRIDLINDNTIWCKSGDNPDSIYGEDYGSAVIDEASRNKAEVWHAVRSTLTATGGKARLIGNVKGKKNWFYEWCRRAERGEDPNAHYARLTVLDAIEAGVIDQSEVEDAQRNLPESVFNELYMAIPSADSGNPFGEDHIYACTGFPLAPGPIVAFGIDLAKKFDYLAIVGLNRAGAVAGFWRWQGANWKTSIASIHEIVGEDTPTLVDSTGLGDPIVEELQIGHGNIRGFNFSNTSKQKIMEGLAVSIQKHETTFPDGPIKTELLNFEFKIMPSGKVTYQAAEGYHDDCVCALALAREIWSTTQPGANLIDFLERSYRPATQETFAEAVRAVARNELNDLYLETRARFAAPELSCAFCAKPVGSARVSDGANIWHLECSP